VTAQGVERESACSWSGRTGKVRQERHARSRRRCGRRSVEGTYPLDKMVVIAQAAEVRDEQRFSRKSCDLRVTSCVARFTSASLARIPVAGTSERHAVR